MTPTVDPRNFMATLHANVDNPRLSDKDFREFVRNSLPVVQYDRPAPPAEEGDRD